MAKKCAIIITPNNDSDEQMNEAGRYAMRLIQFITATAPCNVTVDVKYTDPDDALLDEDDLVDCEGVLETVVRESTQEEKDLLKD